MDTEKTVARVVPGGRAMPTPEVGSPAVGRDVEKGSRTSFFSSRVFWIWVVGMVGSTLTFSLQSYYPSYIGTISNIIPAASASLAFASALLCWQRYGFGFRTRFEAIWLFFTLGTGVWVMAEVTWAVYVFVLNVPNPYPSIADYFYAGGYFPIIAGLVLYFDMFYVAMTRKRLAASLLAIGGAGALAFGFVVPIEMSQGLPALTVLTDLMYPILDMVLVSVTVLCLAIFLGGAVSKWWFLFGGASLLYFIGDEYYLYLASASVNSYYNGSMDDLLFILGYLTFALAFYAHRKEF